MRYFILTIIGLISLMMASCIEDGITTSSTDILTFSRDTVCFDTVFTELGTPTARLLVYNKAKKGVNISSIRFRNSDTRFQINVDGVSGTEFHDVEIRAKDSIYVFIECYLPEESSNVPTLTADELEFVTNGVNQVVRVEAYGQNVTRLRKETITADRTLTAERPYVVFDTLRVAEGATLTIEPGAQILFHDGGALVVDGTLVAVGTPDKKIDLRGDRLDKVLPDAPYDILAGQWKGVRITRNSFDNRLEYVDMRSTESGLMVDSCADLSRSKLTLINSWLHNSQGNVLNSKYAHIDAYGCCFSEAGDAVVSLTGGLHSFLQCTIANNYLFSAIMNPLVSLYHLLPNHVYENELPLMKATFDNCVIHGLVDDINEGDLTGSEVFFRYTSLKSEGADDSNFINCIWGTDPLFLTDRPSYYFNYRLANETPIRTAGNRDFLNSIVETDMDGVSRRQGEGPTPGAYQFVENPTPTE